MVLQYFIRSCRSSLYRFYHLSTKNRNGRTGALPEAENLQSVHKLENEQHGKPPLAVAQNDLKHFKRKLEVGPSLEHFLQNFGQVSGAQRAADVEPSLHPYVDNQSISGKGRKVFFQVYGCQMNVNDTETAWAILQQHGYKKTAIINQADVILVMTCAIREGAEQKVWNLLKQLKGLKRKRMLSSKQSPLKIGILGCMAERLKHELIEKEHMVDLVAGPDSYRDLPRMLSVTESGQTSVNVLLSLDETYADITPIRLNEQTRSAFVSVMRGCDNMCSYCIVPFTRGRERSRPIKSIVEEVKKLSDQGFKEITLLGQNVNSYRDTASEDELPHCRDATHLSSGFSTIYKSKVGGLRFADLLDKVSEVNPEIRIRFTSPHPKDFPDEVLQIIKERPNICKQIHLPAQSGNDRILEQMRRGYTRGAYLDLVAHIRSVLSDVALTSDFICGFCGETKEEFEDTLTLLQEVKYNFAYLFPYSMREKTRAYHRMEDNIPHDVKINRLNRMINVFRKEAEQLNRLQIGSQHLVLVEGPSKRSPTSLCGRNDQNTKVIFPMCEIPVSFGSTRLQSVKPGDYVVVQINTTNSQVLKGLSLYHTTLREFYQNQPEANLISDVL